MKSLVRCNLVAIGDSMLDVFLQIHEATVSCQLHKEACLLCLEYAEKIPVDSIIEVPGAGNASNAAVGAKRLGLSVAIASILGNDEVGKTILAHWKKEKVNTEYVTVDPKRPTNYATILSFQGERTQLVYFQPRKYVLPDIDGADWIYYSAIGDKHEALEKKLLGHLKKNPRQKLAFNPGTTHLRRGLDALKPVIARSDLFIVNKEEAERLLKDGVKTMKTLLMEFVHLGAKIIVITDGPNGSYATDGTTIWNCPIFPGPMVERTGAGDSYTTAFVSALHMGKSIPEAMRYGTANAWSVVQFIGPQKGLLNKDKIQSVLKKFSKIKPSIVEV